MLNQSVHILNQLGVITSFSIAKKITEDEVNKYFIKNKKAGKSNAEIEKQLGQKIVTEIQEAITNQKIPGLLSPQEIATEFGLDKKLVVNMPELNRLITVIVQKLMQKDYGKMSMCYFINGLVNLLNLSEKDFEKFHSKNSKDDDDDDEGDDDDDNEGEEYKDG